MKLGLGWTSRCDIDASIILLDAMGKMVDYVYFSKKRANNGSVIHSGDNLTGAGSGDDEVIYIYLKKMDPRVDSIWPVITIFTAND